MNRKKAEEIRRFNRFYTSAIGSFNFYSIHPLLSDLECRILYEITEWENITAKELLDIIHVDRGYLSRTLARLEKNGYIIRVESEIDRRRKYIRLTDMGKEALSLCVENANKNVEMQFGSLSEKDLKKIVDAMRLIREVFLSGQRPKEI